MEELARLARVFSDPACGEAPALAQRQQAHRGRWHSPQRLPPLPPLLPRAPCPAAAAGPDIDARKKATDSIKDSQELWHTKDYPEFLRTFFDPLLSQLASTAPQFADSELQKLRHAVLEVLSKLPPNEVLRPYAPRLLELCLTILGTDNQANGVVAMRLLLDLNKNLVRSQAAGFEGQFNECVNFIAKV